MGKISLYTSRVPVSMTELVPYTLPGAPNVTYNYVPQVTLVSAGQTSVTQSMAAFTGMSVSLLASGLYKGKLILWANNSTAAEGIQFDFNGGGATMTRFEAGFAATPPGAGLVMGVLTTTALGTAVTVTTATTADAVYTIEFTLKCNVAGTFIPRFAETSVHASGTVTVQAGSYMEIQQIG